MAFDAIHVGTAAVVVSTAARTAVAVVLSIRSRRQGESGWTLALQYLSDAILATGAVLYANAALRPDAPRAVMAALLIYAITWEAFVGASRIQELGTSSAMMGPIGVNGLLDGAQIAAWVFMTLMLVAFGAMVVMARPVLTDAQKLAPIFGVTVPVLVGLSLRGYASGRDAERWVGADTAVGILTAAILGFACWAWV